MVNVPRIKGSHNAILSGIAAADAVAAAIRDGRSGDEIEDYETEVRTGKIGWDLRLVRNVKPLWTKFGTYLGIMLGGLDMWANQIISGTGFGYTLKHGKTGCGSDREGIANTSRSIIRSPTAS